MARRARYWRVHSDVPQEVNFIEGKKRCCAYAVLIPFRNRNVNNFIIVFGKKIYKIIIIFNEKWNEKAKAVNCRF